MASDWDVIGQGTESSTTIAAIVQQAEGDKYVTVSLVLLFISTCKTGLSWLAETDMRREFCATLSHPVILAATQHGNA